MLLVRTAHNAARAFGSAERLIAPTRVHTGWCGRAGLVHDHTTLCAPFSGPREVQPRRGAAVGGAERFEGLVCNVGVRRPPWELSFSDPNDEGVVLGAWCVEP